MPPSIPLFTDPTRALYVAMGMTRRTLDAGPEPDKGDYVRHGYWPGIGMVVKNALKVRSFYLELPSVNLRPLSPHPLITYLFVCPIAPAPVSFCCLPCLSRPMARAVNPRRSSRYPPQTAA